MLKLEDCTEIIRKVRAGEMFLDNRTQIDFGRSIVEIIVSGEHTIEEVSEALNIEAEDLETILTNNGVCID